MLAYLKSRSSALLDYRDSIPPGRSHIIFLYILKNNGDVCELDIFSNPCQSSSLTGGIQQTSASRHRHCTWNKITSYHQQKTQNDYVHLIYPKMSVGFGFSVGDFIAAIELVGTVIDALRSSGSAATEYRELVGQLLSLETALLQVKS